MIVINDARAHLYKKLTAIVIEIGVGVGENNDDSHHEL